MEPDQENHSDPGSLELPETHSLTGVDTKKSTDEPDTAALEDDAELAALACHLQQTVPVVPIDPNFREALQDKLLDVVRSPSSATSKKRSQGVLVFKLGCV